ncbi:MAG: hypothetical protein ACI4OT_05345 [Bacilli bacterium]
MAKKREIKTSQDISKLEEQNKNTFYTFGFRYFETDSKLSSEKVFNSNYSSIIHFLKTNSDLISAMKLISSETYKTTIIDNKLKDVMHFKILEREESKNRITEILVEVYGKSPKAVEELKEGSQFVEFGMTDGCRYIGVIIDYHIIEILYLDPNHLTFVNNKFNIPNKMSYTVPSMYNLKSDKYLNSNTSSFKFDVDINTELAQKYELEKEKEALEIVLLIISELYDETIPKEQAIEMLLDYEKERRNEK